jgi:hypothetical protein
MFQNNFNEMNNVSRLKLQLTNSISQMFGMDDEKEKEMIEPTQENFKYLKQSLTVCLLTSFIVLLTFIILI